jgi:hypothetical protein
MTTPTPQCWRPVPEVCNVWPFWSMSCRLGTRGCKSDHDPHRLIAHAMRDAESINRLNFAVQELADALAAAGGDLIDRKGWVRESDIARAALDAAMGRVVEAKPSNTKENGA